MYEKSSKIDEINYSMFKLILALQNIQIVILIRKISSLLITTFVKLILEQILER